MPTTVHTMYVSTGPVVYQHQHKTFHAAGNYWLFYSDNVNIGYKHSPDNITWSDWVQLGSGEYGTRISIHWDGTYVHYARSEGINPIWYRRGIPQTDGTIQWEPERIVSPLETGVAKGYPFITKDSSGYPWIIFTSGNTNTTRVAKASSLDGSSWEAEVPLDSETVSLDCPMIVALPNNKMYAIWCFYTTRRLRGKFYNGTSWDSDYVVITPESVTNNGMYSVLAIGDTIYLVWPSLATYKIYLQTWTESGGWSEPLEIADTGLSHSIPRITRDGNDLFVFFKVGGDLYYTKRIGIDWTTPKSLFSDDLITYTLATYEHSINGKIGLAWVKSGSFLLRYDFLLLPKTVQLFETLTLQSIYQLWGLNVFGKKTIIYLVQKLRQRIRTRRRVEY